MHAVLLDTSNNFQLSLIKNHSIVENIFMDKLFCTENKIKTSEVILQQMHNIFTKHDVQMQSISCFGVINGPGYFTGIRTALTVAKFFKLALHIPVFSFSSSYIMFKEVENNVGDDDLVVVLSEIGKNGCVMCIFNKTSLMVEHVYLEREELQPFFQKLTTEYPTNKMHAIGSKQFLMRNVNNLSKINYYSDILQPSTRVMSKELLLEYKKNADGVDLKPLYVKIADMILDNKVNIKVDEI